MSSWLCQGDERQRQYADIGIRPSRRPRRITARKRHLQQSTLFPGGKTITLKAAPGAEVTFSGTFRNSDAGKTDGGIVLDGLNIITNDNYFMDLTYGNVKTIAVRNCTVSNIGRCFLRTNNAGNTIEAIEFTNCIITDCGANGYCFLYPQHGVKSVSVKNSTLKNYISGESFFSPKNTTSDIDLTFVFENNTVYKWSKSSSYALCKVDGKYSENSTYTFKNNIISTPGVEGQKPLIVSAKGGTLIAEKNLIDNYGGYSVSNASSSTIEDLSLETLGITQIFPDPENGDFTIVSTSPLATASTTGGIVGDPRWLKTFSQVVTLTTGSLPQNGGSTAPLSGNYEKGDEVTVSATHNYGYRFEAWKDQDGKIVSTENPYTFTIEENTEISATFTLQTLYTLNIEKEGEGATWGEYKLSPQRDNNQYEAGEEVSITVVPNSATTFLYWGDGSSENKQTVIMDKDYSFLMHYDVIPFIVGWDFDSNKIRTEAHEKAITISRPIIPESCISTMETAALPTGVHRKGHSEEKLYIAPDAIPILPTWTIPAISRPNSRLPDTKTSKYTVT